MNAEDADKNSIINLSLQFHSGQALSVVEWIIIYKLSGCI